MAKDKFADYTRPILPVGIGEYYAEYDEEVEMACVFHTEGNGYSYGSFSGMDEAEAYAKKLNESRK